uniref:SUN domain-containing protein n=1 Tax=Steinernema glaseri TaxID=37863 RepID=A0A1I8AW58_9BILA
MEDEESKGQMHKRTHSFDSSTHFTIISSPSTSAVNTMKQEKSRKNSGGALRATKNFFKKMTTTLPKKLRKSSSNGQYVDNFQAATSPFFEIRYPEPEEIPYLPYNIEYQLESESEETVAPDSSISHDEATNYSSTGSRVSDSESLALTNRQASPEKFKSWNDLFVHLKKEITLMRERDAEILANLQSVEEGLRSVRHMDRSTSEHSHLGRRIRIGGPAQNTYI